MERFSALDLDVSGFSNVRGCRGWEGHFLRCKLDGRDGAGQIGRVKAWNELTAWRLERGGQSSVSQLWIWTFLGFPTWEAAETCKAAESGRGIF